MLGVILARLPGPGGPLAIEAVQIYPVIRAGLIFKGRRGEFEPQRVVFVRQEWASGLACSFKKGIPSVDVANPPHKRRKLHRIVFGQDRIVAHDALGRSRPRHSVRIDIGAIKSR